MQCPECGGTHIRKNGKKQGKQNHICVACGRQFIDCYEPHRGYPDDVKRHCLRQYVNGTGFRAIERTTGVHHTTLITWVKQVGDLLPDAYAPDTTPEVGELDELETFVGAKKTIWLWTAVNHVAPGILDWVIGNHSAATFAPLWDRIKDWACYFWVTDGYPVYPQFIPEGDQIVSKTYMTRVEGENTRLRHYLARLHRKTLCYSKSVDMLKHSVRLLLHYLKFGDVPIPKSIHT
ncbi:IS1 family transposase [Leptolyngbya sp. CCNP1308]|nr:IS1 family transposase [Leptolyngbya sp. CCNP1308]MEA5451977.1 IS1 family transposase [Leptolyngbya sp. CCNP1308]